MKDLVFLAQTDTTVGLLSKNKAKLNKIKKREADKPCIVCICPSYLQQIRVPQKYKNIIRRSKKTTFILNQNNFSFRVVSEGEHKKFIDKFGWLYSTSANETNKEFDINFAQKNADIIITDSAGLYQSKPSPIIQLGKRRAKKLR